eukprot:m.97018 g.97018  ORF g.97018 m.97018 type:complete len:528 (-) comp13573_c1_seq1:96-1679(-)
MCFKTCCRLNWLSLSAIRRNAFVVVVVVNYLSLCCLDYIACKMAMNMSKIAVALTVFCALSPTNAQKGSTTKPPTTRTSKAPDADHMLAFSAFPPDDPAHTKHRMTRNFYGDEESVNFDLMYPDKNDTEIANEVLTKDGGLDTVFGFDVTTTTTSTSTSSSEGEGYECVECIAYESYGEGGEGGEDEDEEYKQLRGEFDPLVEEMETSGPSNTTKLLGDWGEDIDADGVTEGDPKGFMDKSVKTNKGFYGHVVRNGSVPNRTAEEVSDGLTKVGVESQPGLNRPEPIFTPGQKPADGKEKLTQREKDDLEQWCIRKVLNSTDNLVEDDIEQCEVTKGRGGALDFLVILGSHTNTSQTNNAAEDLKEEHPIFVPDPDQDRDPLRVAKKSIRAIVTDSLNKVIPVCNASSSVLDNTTNSCVALKRHASTTTSSSSSTSSTSSVSSTVTKTTASSLTSVTSVTTSSTSTSRGDIVGQSDSSKDGFDESLALGLGIGGGVLVLIIIGVVVFKSLKLEERSIFPQPDGTTGI